MNGTYRVHPCLPLLRRRLRSRRGSGMYGEGALMPFLQFLLGIFLELVGFSGILDIESRVGSGEEGRYVAI